jgi:glycosyltransferase involved in cell wall biosynthesis
MSDVCLFVEGAYPYVTGGVSNWLHSLVSNLSSLTFAIVYIGARPEPGRKALYRLPSNVVEFREIFINDPAHIEKLKRSRRRPAAWQAFQALHESIAVGQAYEIERFIAQVSRPGFAELTASDLLYTRESWDLLVRLYQLYAPEESFADFFWTFRFTYLPIFTILETPIPLARVYHAVSTGFCGLLATLAKIRSGRPLLVTEHGLYTREREIEIAQSTWLSQLTPEHRLHNRRLGFFQQWWVNIYRFMERITYTMADALISITGVNQHYQLKHGAEARKLKLIPNGIDIERLASLSPQRSTANFRVGFVGRIVPIKDVKTFIHAIKLAHETIPNLEVFLVGPTEEDAHYFQECCQLAELLGLTSLLRFTGSTDVRPYYSKLDVVVLTSLSEGQPLVILEASCAQLPVVATDVGACRELLMGTTPEDQELGESGIITPVASPYETARAIIRLWREKDVRLRMGRVGQQRVKQLYSQEKLYREYSALYRDAILQK